MIKPHRHLLAALCLALPLAACGEPKAPAAVDPVPTLAFGSCLRQWQDQPVWQSVSALQPEAFVFLGDNVYTDVGAYAGKPLPERIGEAYRELSQQPQFAAFVATARARGTALHATWDDHDYGANDGGADFPWRTQSKGHFLGFFGLERTASGTAEVPGIYHASSVELAGLRVQLLLLDTRSFRSPLKKGPDSSSCPPTGTVANNDPEATILGEEQWAWLAKELAKPADLRLLASSIQVIPDQHCFEKWANFPAERSRLLQLIRDSDANGVVVLSGDRHLAEISQLPAEAVGYPLYEVTASGLNSAIGKLGLVLNREDNRYRVGAGNVTQDNFGTLQIVAGREGPAVALQIRDVAGKVRQQTIVELHRLRRADPNETR